MVFRVENIFEHLIHPLPGFELDSLHGRNQDGPLQEKRGSPLDHVAHAVARNGADHHLPTFQGFLKGCGGANPHGAALTAGVLAMKPKLDNVRAFTVPSPLQDGPSDYGSDFSRAMMLQAPKEKRLYVSGTASIDRAGLTVYQGDPYRQIEQTMAVVEALFRKQNFTFSDVTMTVAYLSRHQDAQLFYDYCQKYLSELPVIATLNTVCRDDLLFEIELDAIQSQ